MRYSPRNITMARNHAGPTHCASVYCFRGFLRVLQSCYSPDRPFTIRRGRLCNFFRIHSAPEPVTTHRNGNVVSNAACQCTDCCRSSSTCHRVAQAITERQSVLFTGIRRRSRTNRAAGFVGTILVFTPDPSILAS
jgi:hypothetical protein